ncbi:hypothetical protein PR048_017876 [Dryococelus australis]|uniref:HAT C-terminal dimerisation domain-containing protein n=1 Tax=Dryococelus australis TaxID=614101 RepID=A0ABQ9HAV7_9NEOP|nr:hypothetical protein PR048_017876 [Dryococelus australis]
MLVKASDPALVSEQVNVCDPTEDILQNANGEMPEIQQESSLPTSSVRVKQVCISCWKVRLAPVRTLRKGLPRNIDVLKIIQSETKDDSEKCDEDGLLRVREVADLFSFLYPRQLMKLSNSDLQKSCEQLTRHYKQYMGSGMYPELLSMRNILTDNQFSPTSKPIYVSQIIVNKDLQEAFADILTAYKLLLTIPVSIATCDRSFCKLKIIKNYLRSTIAQERLSGLAIL